MRRLLPVASLVPTKLWVPELSLCRQWFTLPCTRAHRAARATCVNLTDLSNSQFGLRRTASRQAVIASDRSWSGLRPRVGRDARSHQLPGAAAADTAKLRQSPRPDPGGGRRQVMHAQEWKLPRSNYCDSFMRDDDLSFLSRTSLDMISYDKIRMQQKSSISSSGTANPSS